MIRKTSILSLAAASMLTGCAGIEFSDTATDGMTYMVPQAYILFTTNAECTTTASLMTVPVKARYVKFTSGIGENDLNITMQNGMIQTVGQKTDTKVPETLTAATAAVTGLMTAVEKSAGNKIMVAPTDGAKPKPVTCKPSAKMYMVDENGALTNKVDIL